MRVYTVLPQDDLNHAASAAAEAEAAGFDGLVSMENQHAPFLPHAAAIPATENIKLMTGIAIAFARSPMVVAEECYDLQHSSGGRFILGLGSQVRAHNIRRFSVPWSAPVPRMREYIQALRAIWNCFEKDERLNYEGEHYQFTLMTPNFKPPASGQPMVPVTIAAVGPAMLRLAGEACDGVRLHPFCTRKYLDEVVMKELATGMERTGRKRENFEIVGGGYVVTGPDEETVAKNLEWVRYRVAFYGSTPNYFPVWEVHGLEDLGKKLHQMSREKLWDEMPNEIDDDVVRLFAAVGTFDNIANEIETRFGGASDSVSSGIRETDDPGMPSDLIKDIQKIDSVFTNYKTEW
ncbi:MAG: LLM class F420-dependent oxidoreductase [Rhodospirillaceae bacterium]|nr:LLM class F420-dependent oxidoreductase [Rhodospirillaceae bacterium]